MVTSSLNETSTDQLGNRVVVRLRGVSPPLPPFLQQADGQIFKDDVNGFSSISDICFRTSLEHYIKGLSLRLYASIAVF